MTCIILDDEPPAVQLLRAYAERSPDLQLVADFTSAIEALHFIQEQPVDLIFLDIQMPELTGLQFLKVLRHRPQVVFTTAYENYAVRSYEYDAADYLLKPISLDRFLLAVERVKARLGARQTPPTAVSPAAPPPGPEHLFVKSGHKIVRVDFADLLRLESMSNYVLLHTAKEKIMTLENLSDLVAALPSDRFARIHRSHAVALDKIDYIERNRVVLGEARLPISDSYRAEFMRLLGR